MKYLLVILGLTFWADSFGQIKFYETYKSNPSCNTCDGEVIIGISGLYTPYYIYLTEIGTKTIKYGPFYGSSLRISNLCAKAYLLEVYDACGCYGKYYFNLSSGVLDANVIPTDASCTNPTGALTVNFSNANKYNVYYRKSDQANESGIMGSGPSILIPNLTQGLYYLRISDNNGCEKYTSVIINSKTFTVNNTILNASCNSSNGSISFNLNGGSVPYNIEWYGPSNGQMNSSQSNFSISQLPAGTYTIIIRDNKGCSTTLTIVINTINSINPVFTSGFSDCDGINGCIDILSSGAFLPYMIEYSGQGLSGKQNATSASTKICNLKSGIYKIIITDSRGCKVENSVEVKNGAPWIQLESISRDNCSNDGGFTATIYRFTSFKLYAPDGKLIDSKSGNGVSAAYSKFNLMGGFYKAVLNYNGCEKTFEFEIPSNGPTAVVANQIPINCATGDKGLITLTLTGGKPPYKVQYRHESEVGHSVLRDYNGPEAYITTLKEGYYYICVIDQNGCTTLIKVKADITGGVAILQTSTKPSTCYQPNGCINIKLSTTKYPYIIQLKGPVSKDTAVFTNDFQKCNLLPGDYLITFIDANNCKTELSFHIFDESNDIEDPTKLSLLKGSGQSILIYNDLVTKSYYVWGISFCRGNTRIDSTLGEGISNIFFYKNGNPDTLLTYLSKTKTFLWCKSYTDELKRGCSNLRYLNGPNNFPCFNFTNDNNQLNNISVYPNPTSALVNIDLKEIQFNSIEFEVFTPTGQYLSIQPKKTKDNQFQFDFSSLTKGIYFIKFNINHGKLITKKVLII